MGVIYLVDDEEDIRSSLSRYLQRTLRDADMHVECSASAEAALRQMQETAEPIVVVVSDHTMRPGEMDGVSFLAQVRTLYPDAHRVLMSGFPPQAIMRASDGVVQGFLPKPFKGVDLLAAIAPALERSRVPRGP